MRMYKVLALALLIFSGCSEILVKKPIPLDSGKTKIEVEYAEAGIYLVGTGAGSYYALPEDREFIKVVCKITNKSLFPRNLDLKELSLTDGKISSAPEFAFLFMTKDRVDAKKLEAKESVTLTVYFSWPKQNRNIKLMHLEAGEMTISKQ